MQPQKPIKLLIFALLVAVAQANPAPAAQETSGKTYPIAEKDALDDFNEAASKIDWEKVMKEKREESVKKYQPKDLARLPRALESKKVMVDMTYTLEMDIPDGKGGILYPKGYTFNPLQFMPAYSGIIVVIDPTDEEQISWFEKSAHSKDYRTKLLLTDGVHQDVAARLKRSVYYLNSAIAKRFQLAAVPSVIQQNGTYMEVEQIDVAKKVVE